MLGWGKWATLVGLALLATKSVRAELPAALPSDTGALPATNWIASRGSLRPIMSVGNCVESRFHQALIGPCPFQCVSAQKADRTSWRVDGSSPFVGAYDEYAALFQIEAALNEFNEPFWRMLFLANPPRWATDDAWQNDRTIELRSAPSPIGALPPVSDVSRRPPRRERDCPENAFWKLYAGQRNEAHREFIEGRDFVNRAVDSQRCSQLMDALYQPREHGNPWFSENYSLPILFGPTNYGRYPDGTYPNLPRFRLDMNHLPLQFFSVKLGFAF